MKGKDKKEAISLLKTVIQSCEEGQSGEWDCSTDEGKEGFGAMIDQLEETIKLIKNKVKFTTYKHKKQNG